MPASGESGQMRPRARHNWGNDRNSQSASAVDTRIRAWVEVLIHDGRILWAATADAQEAGRGNLAFFRPCGYNDAQ